LGTQYVGNATIAPEEK